MCSSRLQREWEGDITQGWGMVELLEGSKEPVYIAYYGGRNRPDGQSVKSMLDRASELQHTTPNKTSTTMDAPESDSPNNLYSLSASDSHSTISPPSPLTPTAPGTPFALEVAKNVNPDFDFAYKQVTIESSFPPEHHNMKQSKPTYPHVESFQKRDNFGSMASRTVHQDLTMQRTNSTINARQIAEKAAIPRHVFTSDPSTIDSTYSYEAKTKKPRRGLLGLFSK